MNEAEFKLKISALMLNINKSLNMENIIYLRTLMEKVHITPLNYHSIVNVPHKLPIVSMSPPKLPKNVNVPPKTNKKTKMTLIVF
jgi:hypothetical protein